MAETKRFRNDSTEGRTASFGQFSIDIAPGEEADVPTSTSYTDHNTSSFGPRYASPYVRDGVLVEDHLLQPGESVTYEIEVAIPSFLTEVSATEAEDKAAAEKAAAEKAAADKAAADKAAADKAASEQAAAAATTKEK